MNDKDLMYAGERMIYHAKSVGATDVMVGLSAGTGKSVGVRNGKPSVTLAGGASFSVTAIVNGKHGHTSGTSFAKDDLKRVAEEAVVLAKGVSRNKHLRLARPDEWPCTMAEIHGRLAELDRSDPRHPPTLRELECAARELDACALRFPGISRSEGAEFGFSDNVSVRIASSGFLAIGRSTRYSKHVQVIAEAGKEMKLGSRGHSAFYANDLRSNEECVRYAGEYAVAHLGARPMSTCVLPVLFDNRVSPSLLGAFFGAIDGEQVYRKATFLLDHLGERVFRDDVYIVESPHLSRRLDSRIYDAECVKTTPWRLVEEGRPTMWVTSIESASKLGHPIPTGHMSAHGLSPHNMMLCPTLASRKELLQCMKRGFIVTKIMGRGVNIATGAYSVGAEGFLVENGEITRPVNKVTIAGNLLEMWKTMIPADDCSNNPSGSNAPSCLIEHMTISGKV